MNRSFGAPGAYSDSTGSLRRGARGRLAALAAAIKIAGVAMVAGGLAGRAEATLVISEYIEGTSFNKALEIWNDGATAITFGTDVDAVLQLYSNGSSTATASVQLSPGFVLGPNEVFVIAHPSANAAILAQADQTNSTVVNWNGDDAIVLRAGISGSVLDSIGQVGNDPGTAWGTEPVTTMDHTLRKKFDVGADFDPTDVYDPAQWFDAYPVDSFGDLGIAPIPEPSAVVLVGTMAFIGLARRSRGRRE